jgi:Cft2 family RNA processing exonuclease
MELTNLTREVGIGANSYRLRVGGKSIILDAGLHPKEEGMAALPNFSLLGDSAPDAAVITHAHQDHVGSLPCLTRNFPDMPVYLTWETDRVADVMLHNSVNVMQRQREDNSSGAAPLFTHRGVELSRTQWRRTSLRTPIDLNGERAADSDSLSLEFFHAGHILGSAGVLVRAEGRTFFYTGDVHLDGQSLMAPADFPQDGIDVLMMETTRGDAPQSPDYTREKEKLRLARVIREALEEESSATIPVFALGKTQELLAMLWELKLAGELPHVPIYIGGLSTKVTELYDAFARGIGRKMPELQLLQEVAPYVVSGREIESLRPRKRCIFALSSGMMTENTLSNIFVRQILEDPRQRLIFVGYSDPESPAGVLRRAERGAQVRLAADLPPLELRCRVEEFNFSAHASRESLLAYALKLRPRTIVLVHGDRPAIDWFARELGRELPETRIVVPEPRLPVTL